MSWNISEKNEFINITKKVIMTTYISSDKYHRKYSIDYYLNIIFELINDTSDAPTVH